MNNNLFFSASFTFLFRRHSRQTTTRQNNIVISNQLRLIKSISDGFYSMNST